jgi:hypothetical protein
MSTQPQFDRRYEPAIREALLRAHADVGWMGKPVSAVNMTTAALRHFVQVDQFISDPDERFRYQTPPSALGNVVPIRLTFSPEKEKSQLLKVLSEASRLSYSEEEWHAMHHVIMVTFSCSPILREPKRDLDILFACVRGDSHETIARRHNTNANNVKQIKHARLYRLVRALSPYFPRCGENASPTQVIADQNNQHQRTAAPRSILLSD